MNGQIRQLVNETFDELTSQQLNIYEGQLERVKALTEEMVEKIEDFKALADKVDEIKDKYDSALSNNDPSDLIAKVTELETQFSTIESLMSDFENAPSAGDFDIDDISAPLDNMESWDEDELLMLVTVDIDEFQMLKDGLDEEAQECANLLAKLEELISEYNSIRDEMFE